MNIGLIGCSGLVGIEFINLLEKNHLNIKYDNITLFASNRSANKEILFDKNVMKISKLDENSFDKLDVAIFCATSEVSKNFIPIAIKNNCICIDNSSYFRLSPEVPLVIPEINSELIKDKMVIANPNCSTILLCMVLNPLLKLGSIIKTNVCTYQCVSGAGKNGYIEFHQQLQSLNKNSPNMETNVFKRQYIMNCFSHNSDIDLDSGYNDEEIKMIKETKKILDIDINVTCVRIPVIRSHCEAVSIEFDKIIKLEEIRNYLNLSDGIVIQDDRINNKFPEPLNTQNKFDIQVGRIRYDLTNPKIVNLFLSGDQLLKGAALNAYQILSLV